MTEPTKALKYDQDIANKLPWDLLPFDAIEGMLRVLVYGQRKYTVCGDCLDLNGKFTRVYPDPQLYGDATTDKCPNCHSTNIIIGKHNWRKGFKWTRLINSSFRHLRAIAAGESLDPESLELHVHHLMCCVAFLAEHMTKGYGEDDRYKE